MNFSIFLLFAQVCFGKQFHTTEFSVAQEGGGLLQDDADSEDTAQMIWTDPGNERFYGPFDKEVMSLQSRLSDLPKHDTLQIRLRYWTIDTFDGPSDFAFVNVDGVRIETFTHEYDSTECPAPWTAAFSPHSQREDRVDCYLDLILSVSHSNDFAIIEVGGVVDQDLSDESWGFSNFVAWVEEKEQEFNCKTSEPTLRVDCGYGGISEDVCEESGCCFDDGTPGVPYCFYPEAPSQFSWYSKEVKDSTLMDVHGPFGGSTMSISKTFGNLDDHDTLELRFRYWAIYTWDSSHGDHAFVTIDGTEIAHHQRESHSSCDGWQTGYHLFGDTPSQCFRNIVLSVPHTRDSVTVEIGAILDQLIDDESWAFSNFMMWTAQRDVPAPNVSQLSES